MSPADDGDGAARQGSNAARETKPAPEDGTGLMDERPRELVDRLRRDQHRRSAELLERLGRRRRAGLIRRLAGVVVAGSRAEPPAPRKRLPPPLD